MILLVVLLSLGCADSGSAPEDRGESGFGDKKATEKSPDDSKAARGKSPEKKEVSEEKKALEEKKAAEEDMPPEKNEQHQKQRPAGPGEPASGQSEKPRETARERQAEEVRQGALGSHGPVVSVVRVVDGDTVEISPAIDGTDEVRLIGVDTPETSHPSYGEQPFGQQATSFSVLRLEGERVALEFDAERIDPYNRLLAYAWLPGNQMFNEVLVKQGFAQVATFPPNVKYVGRFRASQREARQAGRGLWGLARGQLCQQTDQGNGIGGCSPRGGGRAEPGRRSPQPKPKPTGGGGVAPPISENECPSRAPIKGNDSSSGELIYHVPGGQFYNVTNPEECFATEADAQAAGYRASQL